MTKDRYFEMVAALGAEVIEEEVPVEFSDLPELVQLSLSIYDALRDEWEYMGGSYVGKNLQNLFDVFSLYEIPKEEQLLVYKIIIIIDKERKALIRERNKSK